VTIVQGHFSRFFSLLSPREGIEHDGHNLGDLAQLALRSLR